MTSDEFEEFYNHVINTAEFKEFTLKQIDNVIIFEEWCKRYPEVQIFDFTKNPIKREN